jgi:hypothetical protein
MKSIRLLFAALVAALSLQATAAPSDYSDLWWNPQESGWGMNIVQQGDTAFVTLFVYDPDGRPTWYVATNAARYAEDASGNPAFRGLLYKTMGPWQGGPFDPSKVSLQIVGDIVIEPRAGGKLEIEYYAAGARVNKIVQRQTFGQPDLGANYHGSFRLRQATPAGVPYGTAEYAAEVLLHLEGSDAFLRVTEISSRCEYRGQRAAAGRFATISGRYECADGESGSFEIADFEVTQHAISGYLRLRNETRHQNGRFAAARY